MIKWNKLALITASMGLLAACGNGDSEEDTTEDTEQVAEESNEESDATTGATQSIIASADDLEKGMSSEGGWIVIFEGDVESD
ncbi:MAG: hypothetical protein L0J40_03635, partial [Alkalibacterium sp.]|nr:hypothetical protein [Alkalibacterium sp.]